MWEDSMNVGFCSYYDMHQLSGFFISQEEYDGSEFGRTLSEHAYGNFTPEEIRLASDNYAAAMKTQRRIWRIRKGRPWILAVVGKQPNFPQLVEALWDTVLKANEWQIDMSNPEVQKVHHVFTSSIINDYNKRYAKYQSTAAHVKRGAKYWLMGKIFHYLVVVPIWIAGLVLIFATGSYFTGNTQTFDIVAAFKRVVSGVFGG
jgi:hypothetical protein